MDVRRAELLQVFTCQQRGHSFRNVLGSVLDAALGCKADDMGHVGHNELNVCVCLTLSLRHDGQT